MRRPNKRRPAFTVSQGRAHHLRPYPGAHLGVLVKHRAIEVQATQGVGIVGTEDLYAAITGQVDPQLGFVDLGPWQLACEMLQQVPGNHLALAVEGRQIAVARAGLGIGVGVGDELVEGQDGFAEAAVADPDVKAAAMVIEGTLVFPQGGEVDHQRLRT